MTKIPKFNTFSEQCAFNETRNNVCFVRKSEMALALNLDLDSEWFRLRVRPSIKRREAFKMAAVDQR